MISRRIPPPVFVLLFCFTYLLLLTFFPGWTWTLYDDLSWTGYFRETPLLDYVKNDWTEQGRLRPLSMVANYFKFWITRSNMHSIQCLRVLELFGISYLFLKYLKKFSKNEWQTLCAFFCLGFWLKSPPLIEQLHWPFTVEMPALTLVLAALLARNQSRKLSYAFLVLAALFKEPMAIFLPLPALLEKNPKETIISGLAGAAYLLFLYLNKHGYGDLYSNNIYPGAAEEIINQSIKDFVPLIPLLFLLPFTKKSRSGESSLWMAFVFCSYAIAYFLLVLPMAWGYTYLLAPSIFLFSLGLFFFLEPFQKNKALGLLVIVLIALFNVRLCYSWTKIYKAMTARKEVFLAVSKIKDPATISSNCPIDRFSFAYAAKLLNPRLEDSHLKDGATCYESLSICCQKSDFYIFGKEGNDYERLKASAYSRKVFFDNNGWTIIDCK